MDTDNQKSELIRKKIRKDFFAGMEPGSRLHRHERDFLDISSDCFNEIGDGVTHPSKVLLELKKRLWSAVEKDKDICVMQRMYIYYATSLYHAIAAFLAYEALMCYISSTSKRIQTHIVAHVGNCSSRVVMASEMLCQIDFVLNSDSGKYRSILLKMKDKGKTPPLNNYETKFFDLIFSEFGNDFGQGKGKLHLRDKVVHRAFPYVINRRRSAPTGWFLIKPDICDDQLTELRDRVDKSKNGWDSDFVVQSLFKVGEDSIHIEQLCRKLCLAYLKTLRSLSGI